MPKAQYRMFADGRRRVVFSRMPEGYAVTIVGLLPSGRFRRRRRDFSFNADSMADANCTLRNVQIRYAEGRL